MFCCAHREPERVGLEMGRGRRYHPRTQEAYMRKPVVEGGGEGGRDGETVSALVSEGLCSWFSPLRPE